MGFGIDTHHLPTISTFAAAEKFWLTSPDPTSKRGNNWATNARPLKDKRSHHFRLVRTFDIEGKTMYQAYLYATPMVSWYQDGRITIRQDASQSSAKFVDRISPFTAFIYQGRMWVKVGRQDVWGKDGEYYTPDGELTIYPAGTQTMVTGALQLHKQRTNMEITRAMRKTLKGFVDYWKTRCAIEPKVVKFGWFKPAMRQEDIVRSLLAAPDNKDLWPVAYEKFSGIDDFWRMAYAVTPDAHYHEPIPLGQLP